jgi:hypothetical protein
MAEICKDKDSVLTPECFVGYANPACGGLFDPSKFQMEQTLFSNAYSDLINNFGITIEYYVHTFDTATADLLLGEEPIAPFIGPTQLKMYVELVEPSPRYQQYGIVSEDEFTGYLHIQTFYDTMQAMVLHLGTEGYDYFITESGEHYIIINNGIHGTVHQRVEPKAGDLIVVSALGCDRPGDRTAKIFEITERMDQDTQGQLNPMLGHYIWRIKAKRYEPSAEPYAPEEGGDDQIYDNLLSHKLSSTIVTPFSSTPKTYTWDIDDESTSKVYNMNINKNDIYGDYY